MQFAGELRARRVVLAGGARARRSGVVQCPHHGGSLQRSLWSHACIRAMRVRLLATIVSLQCWSTRLIPPSSTQAHGSTRGNP